MIKTLSLEEIEAEIDSIQAKAIQLKGDCEYIMNRLRWLQRFYKLKMARYVQPQ